MAALISILLEMPKGDAMSSSGFSIRTTWVTRICKEKNFIIRIQVHPHQGLTPGLEVSVNSPGICGVSPEEKRPRWEGFAENWEKEGFKSGIKEWGGKTDDKNCLRQVRQNTLNSVNARPQNTCNVSSSLRQNSFTGTNRLPRKLYKDGIHKIF